MRYVLAIIILFVAAPSFADPSLTAIANQAYSDGYAAGLSGQQPFFNSPYYADPESTVYNDYWQQGLDAASDGLPRGSVASDADYLKGFRDGYSGVTPQLPSDPAASDQYSDGYNTGFDFAALGINPTYAPGMTPAAGADQYTPAPSVFAGTLSFTGSYVSGLIRRYGIPAILVGVAVCGWLLVRRLAKGSL